MERPVDVNGMIVDASEDRNDAPCEPCGTLGGDETSDDTFLGIPTIVWIGICVVLVIVLMYYMFMSDGFTAATTHPMDVAGDFPWELKMSCPTKASA